MSAAEDLDRMTIITDLAIEQYARKAREELDMLAVFYKRSIAQRVRWIKEKHHANR